MLYISTRGAAEGKTFADIAFEGFASDCGLYVPESFPKFTAEDIALLRGRDFPSIAWEVMRRFWTQIPEADLWALCRDAWQPQNFPNGRDPFKAHDVAPIKWLKDQVGIFELSNGPTLAFDDFSLQFLKRLHARHLGTEAKNLTLVGATTGDMGAAAEYAFGERKDTRVVMLSPKDRMSKFQSAQLYSDLDENVLNLEVEGTFDDCQELVYGILEDDDFRTSNGLGAVNSYLWARIAVQVACYFYAYIQATGSQREPVVFCVPCGNFGNAYAGVVARKMGLPILRILVATNENDAMDRFLRTGVYAPRRAATSAMRTHAGSPRRWGFRSCASSSARTKTTRWTSSFARVAMRRSPRARRSQRPRPPLTSRAPRASSASSSRSSTATARASAN